MPDRQSVHEVLELLKGQWTVAVLASLALGERQFNDLLADVNLIEEHIGWTSHPRPLTARVLTDTLRRLQGHQLVDRRSNGNQFSAVWYRLTHDGRSLLRALRPLANWARQHRRNSESTTGRASSEP
ncbi:winged helix-turn-helix transcriptional regulator [Amycolatopsis halotolerans]|uniref:Winged helix-turn-helix transcriptional regulator n=1 Tax=Amycolatopsis halotolerans TaxID=330083 RepID=A0ABV7QA58_9PSEU